MADENYLLHFGVDGEQEVNAAISDMAQNFSRVNKIIRENDEVTGKYKVTLEGLDNVGREMSRMWAAAGLGVTQYSTKLKEITSEAQAAKTALDNLNKVQRLQTQYNNTVNQLRGRYGNSDLKNADWEGSTNVGGAKVANDFLQEQYNLTKIQEAIQAEGKLHARALLDNEEIDRKEIDRIKRKHIAEGQAWEEYRKRELSAIKTHAQALKDNQKFDQGVTADHLIGVNSDYTPTRGDASFQTQNLAQYRQGLEELRRVSANSVVPLKEQQQLLSDIASNRLPKVTAANAALIGPMQNVVNTVKEGTSVFGGFGNKIKEHSAAWDHFVGTFTGFALYQGIYNFVYRMKDAVAISMELGIRLSEIQTIATHPITSNRDSLNASIGEMSSRWNSRMENTSEGVYQSLSNQIGQGSDTFLFQKTSIDLAKAGVTDLDNAVNLLSSTLNAFGKSSAEAEPQAAILFETIYKGRVRAEEMSNTIGRLVIMSDQLGVTLAESGAAIALTTIKGTKFSEAMTFTRNMMMGMIKPGKEMQQFFKDIGATTPEAAVAAFRFGGLLEKIAERARGGSKEMAELFHNIRGFMGGTILTSNDFAPILADIQNGRDRYEKATELRMNDPAEKFKKEMNEIRNLFVNGFGRSAVDSLGRLSGGFLDLSSNVNLVVKGATTLAFTLAAGKMFSLAGAGARGLGLILDELSMKFRGVTTANAIMTKTARAEAGAAGAALAGGVMNLAVGGALAYFMLRKSDSQKYDENVAARTIDDLTKIQKIVRETAYHYEDMGRILDSNISDEMLESTTKTSEKQKELSEHIKNTKDNLEANINARKEELRTIERQYKVDKDQQTEYNKYATEAGKHVRELQGEVDKLNTLLEKSQNALLDINRSADSSKLERILDLSGADPRQRFMAYGERASNLAATGKQYTLEGDMENARQAFQEAEQYLNKAFQASGNTANIEGYFDQLTAIRREAEAIEQARLHVEGDPKADELTYQKDEEEKYTKLAEDMTESLSEQEKYIAQQKTSLAELVGIHTDVNAILQQETLTQDDIDSFYKRHLIDVENEKESLKEIVAALEKQKALSNEIAGEATKQQTLVEKQRDLHEKMSRAQELSQTAKTDRSQIATRAEELGLITAKPSFIDEYMQLSNILQEKYVKPIIPTEESYAASREFVALREQKKAEGEQLRILGRQLQDNNLPVAEQEVLYTKILEKIESIQKINSQMYLPISKQSQTLNSKAPDLIDMIAGKGPENPGAIKNLREWLPLQEEVDALEKTLSTANQLQTIRQNSQQPADIAKAASATVAQGFQDELITARELLGTYERIANFRNGGLPGAMMDPYGLTPMNSPVPQGLAYGGRAYGTDTVPAMLTPGEFVVNRRATAQNLDLLLALNNGYAQGGEVDSFEKLLAEMLKNYPGFANLFKGGDQGILTGALGMLGSKQSQISNFGYSGGQNIFGFDNIFTAGHYAQGGVVGSTFARRAHSGVTTYMRPEPVGVGSTNTVNHNNFQIASSGNTRIDAKTLVRSVNREQSRGGVQLRSNRRRVIG